MGGALTSYVVNCFWGRSFLLPLSHDTSAVAFPRVVASTHHQDPMTRCECTWGDRTLVLGLVTLLWDLQIPHGFPFTPRG